MISIPTDASGVVLVTLDCSRPGDPRTSLGAASITAALHDAGVAVRQVVAAVNTPDFDLARFTRDVVVAVRAAGSNALVGFGAYVWNDAEVRRITATLRHVTTARIVLGGPQISFARPGTLESAYPNVDLFVRGQGERAMVALATGTDPGGIPGVHVAGSADLAARADGALDDLPSPYLAGLLRPGRSVRWETQRGCPFQCSFCQHREPGERGSRHELGAGRLRAELHLFRAAGVERVSVLDPIFHARRDEGLPILDHARRIGLSAELSLQCRFETMSGRFLDALEGLNVCLEFGLQTVHADEAKAIHRPNRIDRVEAVIACLHERRIRFEVSLIYGLPLQTLESFRASVDWCLERGVPAVRAYPLMLLRGTPLEAERERWRLVEDGRVVPVVIGSDRFDEVDHAAMTEIATWLEQTAYVNPRRVPDHFGARLRGAA